MSSITAHQAKLNLKLVPKKKRLEIGKCSKRLNPGKIQREPTFQVVLDALALTLCYSAFLITADVPEVYMHQFWNSIYKHDTFYRFKMDKRKRFKLNLEIFRDIFKICLLEINSLNDVVVDHMHQPWRTFAALINKSLSGKTTDLIYRINNEAYKKKEKMYYPWFTKVIIHYFITQDKTISWRNKIKMHTTRDDYLINTLRFVYAKEETQIYGAILTECLTSPEMKETQAYMTYLVSTETPTRKSMRVKRPAKKSTETPTRGVVIRETPEMSLTKKEKVDVTRGKGIELLSQVALTEDAQFEEVQKTSMRDFYKTHPSRSGIVTKTARSVAKIKPSVTSEGTGVKPEVLDMTEEESSESKFESWGNGEDDSNNEQVSSDEDSDQKKDNDDDKTQSDNEHESNSEHETDESESGSESDHDESEENEKDDDEDETKITDKAEGDEEMDFTTSKLYNDVDIRLNEPVDTDEGFVQVEGTDAAMTNVQQMNDNMEILQVKKDAHVTLYTISQKTKVSITSSSYSSDLAAKFLNFSNILHSDAEIVSPMDVHVQHEVPTTNPPSTLPDFTLVFQFNNRVTTLKKEVDKLKKDDPLKTQVTALVYEHLDAKLGATKDEFMNFHSASITARITEQVKNQLPQILPKKASNFAPPDAATLTEFEVKKILIDKMDKSESYLAAPEHRECYEGFKKSYDLDKTLFSTYGKVYSLKRSRKYKDEDPSAGSD
uniref:Uncharacterized protein n=1 Tax=Tanacetum cinerariifolium TaxID=118510 RepID=A0A6L2MHZ4_TANCI|nr:hypothetical protein [Tanacetum cinerariifolium]